jgi:site-specific recombinase XerD
MTDLTIQSTQTIDLIRHEIDRDPSLKSANTVRSYGADLRSFETWRAGRPMTKLLVEQYAAELQQAGKAPNTINRALAAVRWWARRLSDLALEDSTLEAGQVGVIVKQAERVTMVKDVTGSRKQRGRHLASGELAALLQTCEVDSSPAGLRDAVMIALAWATGIRRDEIAGLDYADFTSTGEGEGELDIRGKGDKDRVAYVFDGAFSFLQDWLQVRGDEPGPLFWAINKGGRLLPGTRLSGEALRQILEKRVVFAGVKSLTWHDFRRTFVGNLLDANTDLVTVQKLAGHSDPSTTSRYDRRGDEVKRKAVKVLFVPYHGRKA